jgi:hypothetical protein
MAKIAFVRRDLVDDKPHRSGEQLIYGTWFVQPSSDPDGVCTWQLGEKHHFRAAWVAAIPFIPRTMGIKGRSSAATRFLGRASPSAAPAAHQGEARHPAAGPTPIYLEEIRRAGQPPGTIEWE